MAAARTTKTETHERKKPPIVRGEEPWRGRFDSGEDVRDSDQRKPLGVPLTPFIVVPRNTELGTARIGGRAVKSSDSEFRILSQERTMRAAIDAHELTKEVLKVFGSEPMNAQTLRDMIAWVQAQVVE